MVLPVPLVVASIAMACIPFFDYPEVRSASAIGLSVAPHKHSTAGGVQAPRGVGGAHRRKPLPDVGRGLREVARYALMPPSA